MLSSHQASGLACSHKQLFPESPARWARLTCSRKNSCTNPAAALCATKRLANTPAQPPSGGEGLLATSDVARQLPQTSSWRLAEQHLVLLGVMASVIMGAMCCIFLAAIPTLLAIKKAAESMEKLADTTREELPGTMAAVRLSGMELSDLTMELSDLGQEITAGVKRSTQAVRAAEDGIRRASSLASAGTIKSSNSRPRDSPAIGSPESKERPADDSPGQDDRQEPDNTGTNV